MTDNTTEKKQRKTRAPRRPGFSRRDYWLAQLEISTILEAAQELYDAAAASHPATSKAVRSLDGIVKYASLARFDLEKESARIHGQDGIVPMGTVEDLLTREVAVMTVVPNEHNTTPEDDSDFELANA